MLRRRLLLLLAALSLALLACNPGVEVPRQDATVACAMCVFKMDDARGCTWAIELDGAYHHVLGRIPKDHATHAPDGMCNMPRKATVEGKLKDGIFVAKVFELQPADGVPEQPKYSEEDKH